MNYPIRPDGNSTVEFSAVSSGGHQRLYWFVDDTFVGEGNPIFWPGRFIVRVVDEQGQSSAAALTALPAD